MKKIIIAAALAALVTSPALAAKQTKAHKRTPHVTHGNAWVQPSARHAQARYFAAPNREDSWLDLQPGRDFDKR